jgi:ribosomal protein S18 acetylase RimI-like enzyme
MPSDAMPSREKLNIEISRETADDISGILKLTEEAWQATYPNEEAGILASDIEHRFKNLNTEGERERRKKMIETRGPDVLSIVAKVNGEIVGACAVRRDSEVNELMSINVSPRFKRMGIGSQMWEEARNFLDKEKDTLVKVAEYNQNAIRFYKSMGFEGTDKKIEDERFRMRNGKIIIQIEMLRPAENPKK